MINATLKRYQEKFPHYLEFFEILQQIHLLRKTHNKLWSKDIFSFDRRMAARKLAANKPLINLQHDPFDDEMPRHYFLDLLTVAENTHPDAVENLRKTISTDITTYTEMVRKLFSKTEKSSTGAPASTDKPEEYFDLITFFLHQSLKPFFSQLALKSKDLFEKQMWTQGVCPICSQTPDLSLLRNEEGNRSLFCLQCDFEWPYKRLQCH
jgi:FdhE protein